MTVDSRELANRWGVSDGVAGVWCRLGVVVHRCLVLLDDWLCDELGLSRRPRGKHAPD